MPLIGGILCDEIGSGLSTFVFTSIIALGQLIFLLSVFLKSYAIGLIGIGIFSLGTETQGVSHSSILTEWFKNKEIYSAFSVGLSISLLGKALSTSTQPKAFTLGSLVFAYIIGVSVCVFSIACSLGALLLNKKKNHLLGINKNLKTSNRFKFKDLKKFKLPFWLVCLSIMFVYVDILSFMNIGSDYYQKRFNYDSIEAGNIIGLVFMINIFLFPVVGLVLDKIGRRGEFIILSTLMLGLVHVCFIFTPESSRPVYPIFYMVLLGVGYSIYGSAIWPCINHLVPEELIGTGFGIAYCILNFGQFFASPLIGYIKQTTTKDKGYFWVSVFFVLAGALGTLVSVTFYINDIKTVENLELSKPLLEKKSFDEED